MASLNTVTLILAVSLAVVIASPGVDRNGNGRHNVGGGFGGSINSGAAPSTSYAAPLSGGNSDPGSFFDSSSPSRPSTNYARPQGSGGQSGEYSGSQGGFASGSGGFGGNNGDQHGVFGGTHGGNQGGFGENNGGS